MEKKSSNQIKENEQLVAQELKGLSISEITEEILIQCGGYGLFQKKLTFLIVIFIIFYGHSLLTMVFIREKIPFACYPSNFNESMIPSNITLDEFLNNITVEEEKCSVYKLVSEEGLYVLPTINSTKETCKYGRKFYTKEISSIVSEFDLACEREWMKNTAVSVMFGGFFLGNLAFGILSDKFGRFKTYCAAEVLIIISSFAKTQAPNYIIFVIIYFFEGFGFSGNFVILYTNIIECVSQQYKTHINFITNGAFAVGGTILAGVAFLLRKWQHLIYAATIPHILIVIVAFKYLPESPRWILSKGRSSEAEESFNRIARTNKKDNEDTVNRVRKLQREAESKSKFDEYPGKKNRKTYTPIDLLKTRRRAKISSNLWFNWLVSSMIYFGMTLISVDMSGNRYMNFLLMAAVEIPGNILGYFSFKWFGHRKPLCFFLIFGGINCIVSNFVSKVNIWLPLILAVLGKLGGTAAFVGIFLTSAELFPTEVRNIGMGVGSSCARAGGLIAPIIIGLNVYGSWIPLSVYGFIGTLAGFLILLVPETKDLYLLQKLEDMDNL
ncbi:organic cation transporter protein [Octopus bimaculoides]|uniref:Major facilitator superfamily (MFS) profile domain-containing protein n=1 Tax=Octopus bimaculoides TaxID=37653 RepID=A0A0L8FVJ7_OCTBM|nr:organic cation transporter protein [Octopus bimaculoides]|eukprot:XP_014786494.1 PREDICTED: organic cation transporter protein-like [Octopus bimaculoides]